MRSTALNQESPALYYPTAWRVWPVMDVVVRSNEPSEVLLPAIRQKVHELDAELALAKVRTMGEWLSNSAAQPRLNSILLAVFASVALVIAAIGIYGVMAYSVSERTREIGLQIALGATPREVLQLVVREGLTIVSIGLGLGLADALALGRTVSTLVYGVKVRDPITFGVVGVVLAAVAFAACAVPASRAARVDPMIALRYE